MPGPNGEECQKCQCFFPLKSQIVGHEQGACKAVAPTFLLKQGQMNAFAYPSVTTKDWCIHNFKIKDEYVQ